MADMTPAEWRQQYGPEWYKTEEYRAHCHEVWLRVTTPEERAYYQSEEYRELCRETARRSAAHESNHCVRCNLAGCLPRGCCDGQGCHDCWCRRNHPDAHTRIPPRPGDPGVLSGEEVGRICTEALLWEQIKDVAGS